MTSSAAYTLLGLTAIVAALVGILVFAVMKFMAAAREARGQGSPGADRAASVADALAEVVTHVQADRTSAELARRATAFRLEVAGTLHALHAAFARDVDETRAREALAALDKLVRQAETPAGPVDLKTVIDTAVSGYRITARARGGELVVQGHFATVVAQADAVDWVISTLVSRALDACQRAGMAPVVAIRGERDDEARRLRVSIDDNGPGDVPLPERDVVASVVGSAGGRVETDTSPMGGARICLDLPIAPAR